MDEADDHAAAPSAGIHVAIDHDLGIDPGDFVVDILDLELGALLALDLQQTLDAGVLQHALGVPDRAHHQPRVQLGGGNQRFLDVVVHRRFLGGDKPRPHIHAGRPHRERGDEAARIGHAARRNEWNFQLLRGARQQNHVGHVVFAGVAAALEAIDADGVAADLLGFQRMPNRGAFVDHLDAGCLQGRHILLRAASRGFNDPDSAFPDRGNVFRIRRRRE